jgi:hypothetical protein
MSGTWVRLLASARVKGVSNLGLRLVHHALYANLTQLLLRHRLTPLWSPPAESQEHICNDGGSASGESRFTWRRRWDSSNPARTRHCPLPARATPSAVQSPSPRNRLTNHQMNRRPHEESWRPPAQNVQSVELWRGEGWQSAAPRLRGTHRTQRARQADR